MMNEELNEYRYFNLQKIPEFTLILISYLYSIEKYILQNFMLYQYREFKVIVNKSTLRFSENIRSGVH